MTLERLLQTQTEPRAWHTHFGSGTFHAGFECKGCSAFTCGRYNKPGTAVKCTHAPNMQDRVCLPRCIAEILGTALAIWLGQSTVANELLAHTKGHGMGFGWVSFGEQPCHQPPRMDTIMTACRVELYGRSQQSVRSREADMNNASITSGIVSMTRERLCGRVWAGFRRRGPADRLDLGVLQPGSGAGGLDQWLRHHIGLRILRDRIQHRLWCARMYSQAMSQVVTSFHRVAVCINCPQTYLLRCCKACCHK